VKKITDDTMVYYSARSANIIDLVCPDGLSAYSRETEAEVRECYPDAVRITLGEAVERKAKAFKHPASYTTAEVFNEMLNILPPLSWKRTVDGESFKMCEMTSGTVTQIYARIGDRYFTLADDVSTPHAEILRRCKEV